MNTSGYRQETARICICDSEVAYGEHLMEYLKRAGQLPFDIYLYTNREVFMSRECPGTVKLLVIAESQYKMCMTGDGNLMQSMRHGKPMKLIGVYSPVTRCLQTTFALCMGQLLAQKSPVLYLNFEAYSGLEILLDRSFRGSVSDLLYYNDCAREKLAGQLQYMTEKAGKLDFLPPMESFIQLKSIRQDQWMDLFRSIEKVTEYEYCILDLSEQVDGILEILRQCDLVFTITREDGFAEAKMRQYEVLLKSTQYEDIFMKTRRCQLPVFRELPAGILLLTHGELAACVRSIMEGEGLL